MPGVPGRSGGRNAVPSALKLVRGNPGKRPLNHDEPQPVAGAPAAPSWLSAEAKAAWKRWVRDLEPTKMLTQVDRASLASVCEAEALLEAASKEVQEHGPTVYVVEKEFNDGTRLYAKAATNPAVNTMLKAMATIRAFAAEFGGTPGARSRIHVPQTEKPKGSADLLSS